LKNKSKDKEIQQFIYKRREGKEKRTCMLIVEGCNNPHMAIVLQDRCETESDSDSDIDMVKGFSICAKDLILRLNCTTFV